MKTIRNYDVDYNVSDPERSNHNSAEGVIRELRKKWFRKMVRKRVPRKLWYYGYQKYFKTMQYIKNYSCGLNGRTSNEKVTSKITDIAELLDFGFYVRCWYRENSGLVETLQGRWLGV